MNLRFLLKIQNSYKKFLISYIEKTDFELSFSLPKIDTSNSSEIENYFHFYKDLEKKCRIRYEYKNTRYWEVPNKLVFEDEKSYLIYIDKLEDFKIFKQNYEYLKSCRDVHLWHLENWWDLNNWLSKNIFLISKYDLNFWKKIMLVVDYFLKNKNSNKFLRELDIKVDTKFIENNKKLIKSILYFLLNLEQNTNFEEYFGIKQKPVFIRFRFLDENLNFWLCRDVHLWHLEKNAKICRDVSLKHLNNQKHLNNINDIYLKIEDFEQLDFWEKIQKIFIVENEINYLTFPEIKNSMVIWWAGFKVNILKNTKFLKEKNIFYWWDIDAHWFKILANLRKYFPQTKSIFMDEKIFLEFSEYRVFGQNLTESEIEKLKQNLTKQEFELLNFVNNNNFRLEQEAINQNYILENLKKLTRVFSPLY